MCSYRPSSQSVVCYLEQCESFISVLASQFVKIIFMADFYINALISQYEAYRNLTTYATTIDLVVCSDSVTVKNISASDASTVADHCFVSQFSCKYFKPFSLKFRVIKKFILKFAGFHEIPGKV